MGWESGEGGRVVTWQDGKGGKVVRWQGGKGGRMLRQKGGRYLVLFKSGGHKMSPRFHIFVSDVNQGMKGWDGFKTFWHGCRYRKTVLRYFTSC